MAATQASRGRLVNTVSFFPAEIRAPAGTLHGISGYQVCYSSKPLYAPTDHVDVLIAFNPAAYWVSQKQCTEKTVIYVDQQSFEAKHWKKAQLDHLDRNQLEKRFIQVPLTEVTLEVGQKHALTFAQARKNKNFTALGFSLWLSDCEPEQAFEFLEKKFHDKPQILEQALACLKAGYHLGETMEVHQMKLFENIPLNLKKQQTSLYNGNQAIVLASAKVAALTRRQVALYGYPITPASEILEYAQKFPKALDVLQAEDEMASLGMSLGSAFSGQLSLSCTSGPGFDLKAELMGLAVSAELPCVIINVQRAGPSTGMPTKVEQSDLNAALYGRHGDSPVPVLAPSTPNQCFEVTLQAFQWALKAKTPVIVLSDAALAQSTGRVDVEQSKSFDLLPTLKEQPEGANIWQRKEDGTKPWTIPGQKGAEHCLTGLESDYHTGQISYDGANHALMTQTRRKKIENLAQICPMAPKPSEKSTLILSFGSAAAVVQGWIYDQEPQDCDFWPMTMLYPLAKNFEEIFSSYEKIIVIEMNEGQLYRYLKAQSSHQKIKSLSWLGSGLLTQNWLNENLHKPLNEGKD